MKTYANDNRNIFAVAQPDLARPKLWIKFGRVCHVRVVMVRIQYIIYSESPGRTLKATNGFRYQGSANIFALTTKIAARAPGSGGAFCHPFFDDINNIIRPSRWRSPTRDIGKCRYNANIIEFAIAYLSDLHIHLATISVKQREREREM